MSAARNLRPVGILGGMGPAATVLLMTRVMALTPARDDSDHVPLIVDNNTQVPSRIKAIIEGTGVDPGPVLARMATSLEQYGAQALAMPCNTAHHYAKSIENAVRIPLLNMVTLSVEQISSMHLSNRRVGVLASPAVQMTGIFDRALSAEGLQSVYPQDQGPMLAAIRATKVDSTDSSARKIIEHASRELARAGADTLLIACSEFSIVAGAVTVPVPLVDTIDVLARAVVDFATGKINVVDVTAAADERSA